MYSEGFDKWTKLNKNMIGPLSEWHKSHAELYQKILEQQLELAGEGVSRLSTQIKKIGTLKKPEDVINYNKECVTENITATIDYWQKMLQTYLDGVDETSKIYTSMQDGKSKSTNKS